VLEGCRTGEVQEVFGTGTAAVISPVGVFSYKGKEVTVNKGQTGPLARRLYDYLTRLQRGEEEDKLGWVERIDKLDLEELANSQA
jgi:branched-chain amino acid aminotransferase